MIHPKPGEVYWVDLGAAAKYRPVMVVSREDADAPRALAVCVPLTTQIRGSSYETKLPRVRWMPGAEDGVANAQGVTSIEYARLERKAGRYEVKIIEEVRAAIAWMLELKRND
jgi:mRNA interferase MazF